MEAHHVVVVGADPLGGIQDATFQSRIDLAAGEQHGGGSEALQDAAAQSGHTHFKAAEVGYAVNPPVEPAPHLHPGVTAGKRHQADGGVELPPQLHPAARVEPGVHLLGVEPKGKAGEELCGGKLTGPVVAHPTPKVSRPLAHGIEGLQRGHEFAAAVHGNVEPAAGHLPAQIGQ